MNVTVRGRTQHFRTVTFDRTQNTVRLIEQRLLPHEFKIVATRNFRETAAAITDMIVRGIQEKASAQQPDIGLAQGALTFRGNDLKKFSTHIKNIYKVLKNARPTAVDPVNAMNGVRRHMAPGQTVAERQFLALAAAEEFASEDVRHCEAIGRHGAKLIRNSMKILTHCNAGWLAFVDIGSATAPMYAAQAQGKKFHVFCDETRPRSQGATPHRVGTGTAKNFAPGHRRQLPRRPSDAAWQDRPVLVGSDRTLGRTGEVARQINTYTKAVQHALHKIPFYVAIPLSTIDWNLNCGFAIPIEERNEGEVLGAWRTILRSKIRNPKSENGPACLRSRGRSNQRRKQSWF